MNCGDSDKRNKKYFETFSKTSYFQKLIFNEIHDDNISLEGEDKIIFDVGAHRGESVTFFNQIFPLAQIYSFEPIPKMANLIRKLRIKNPILNNRANQTTREKHIRTPHVKTINSASQIIRS